MRNELPSVDLSQGFRLGEWLVRPRANKLVCDDGDTHVEPKVMDVLMLLAEASGQVVTRAELFERVWHGVVVNEESLTRTISELRRALHDKSRNPSYIKTIPKRGYVLIAEVGTTGIADITMIPQPNCDVARLPSVAVLPFANLSPDQDNEYFSDGLTEELIAMLAQVRGLHVAARTSVFSFKDKNLSVKEIGEGLDVSHVLEGSVRKTATQLRITTQLIKVDDGFHVWSASFDLKMANVFQMQEGIAEAVVDALRLKLGVDHPFTPVNDASGNPRAYELFLQGRLKYQNEQFGLTYSGTEQLQQAVQISPNFPDAHGLNAYVRSLNSIVAPYRNSRSEIRRSYKAALAINPFQEEALMAKAIDVRWQSWDWTKVRAIFERALTSAPNCPHVLSQFACRFYRDLCVFDMAQYLLERAVTLDPINAAPRESLSFVLRYQRQYEAALEQAERALSINASHGFANYARVLALLALQEYSVAEEAIGKIALLTGSDDPLLLNCQGRFYVATREVQQTEQLKKHLLGLSRQPNGEQHGITVGWISLMQGDVEEAVRYLQTCFDLQISQILTTRAFAQTLDQGESTLLAHPVLQDFLRQMNLDDDSIGNYHADGLFDDERSLTSAPAWAR